MRVTLALVLAMVVCAGSAVPAHAQAQDKKEAKRLLLQGDAAFARKEHKTALVRYQQAYEAFPSAKIFFPMAQTEEKLGLDLEALVHYEQLLDEVGSEISNDVKSEARIRIGQIEQRLALVRFNVKPEGSRVLVDDIEYGDLSRAIRRKPGVHRYQLSKDGYKAIEGSLDLKAGTRLDVQKDLQPGGGKSTAVNQSHGTPHVMPEHPEHPEHGDETPAPLGTAGRILYGGIAGSAA